jgi:hypothetical protein
MVLGAEGRDQGHQGRSALGDQGHQGRSALLKYRGEWSDLHTRIRN